MEASSSKVRVEDVSGGSSADDELRLLERFNRTLEKQREHDLATYRFARHGIEAQRAHEAKRRMGRSPGRGALSASDDESDKMDSERRRRSSIAPSLLSSGTASLMHKVAQARRLFVRDANSVERLSSEQCEQRIRALNTLALVGEAKADDQEAIRQLLLILDLQKRQRELVPSGGGGDAAFEPAFEQAVTLSRLHAALQRAGNAKEAANFRSNATQAWAHLAEESPAVLSRKVADAFVPPLAKKFKGRPPLSPAAVFSSPRRPQTAPSPNAGGRESTRFDLTRLEAHLHLFWEFALSWSSLTYRQQLARQLFERGSQSLTQPFRSIPLLRHTLDLYESLVKAEPTPDRQQGLAETLYVLAIHLAHSHEGDLDEVMDKYERSIAILERLLTDAPSPEIRNTLGKAQANLASHVSRSSRADARGQALRLGRACVQVYEVLVAGAPTRPRRQELAKAYFHLAFYLSIVQPTRRELRAEAVRAGERSVEILRALVEEESSFERVRDLGAAERQLEDHRGRVDQTYASDQTCASTS